jgi:bacillithiol biosynthesis deacetylase BshB2
MVGLRDKTIEFEEDEKMTKLMLSFIEEVKPSLIITFYPGYSVHPDHEATGAAVVRAVESLPENERPKLHCVAFSNNCVEELGEPDIIHDVTEVSEIKMEAIKAHRSQTELMVADMSEKIKIQDPQTLAWIRNERFWTYKF